MNIILIGPISENVERAKRVFTLAEKLLTEQGHTVVSNPMRNHTPGKSEAWYMQRSLNKICGLVNGNTKDLCAVILPNSGNSDGAKCEIALVKKLRIDYVTIYGMLDLATCDIILQEYNRKEVN